MVNKEFKYGNKTLMSKVLKKCTESLRYKALGVIALIVVCLGFFPTVRSGLQDSISAIYASVLVTLTNQDRASQNLAELKVNPLLEKAAQMKADDMASKGYFAHNTPDGKLPWYWFEQAGYDYSYAGENLAVNFENSEDIETAWKNSPLHWYNIISPNYTEIGIATSTGVYKGRMAVFVVQMFGTPRR